VIDHVGFEVSDLAVSARFYDALFFVLGARRLIDSGHAVAYGINAPMIWFVVRGRPAGPGYGHLALQASGKAAVDAAHAGGLANGGTDDGAPGQRPQYGRRYYAAYLLDPDRLRVEIVSHR
jgi:catechol 2,3-dioxygenase-like lactoylglutathione lyase family enzyme